MAISYETKYISVGANRFSSVSSADPETGVIAFGAGRTVALWDPRVSLPKLTQSCPSLISVIGNRTHQAVSQERPYQGIPLRSPSSNTCLPDQIQPTRAKARTTQEVVPLFLETKRATFRTGRLLPRGRNMKIDSNMIADGLQRLMKELYPPWVFSPLTIRWIRGCFCPEETMGRSRFSAGGLKRDGM